MANYSTLKAAVANVVKTNGTQAITGANLQTVLLSIINSVGGGGYIFKGVATPSTSAGTPDENVFYIGGAGTYANFGTSVVVPPTNIAVFKYNGTWTCEQVMVENGGVFDISAFNAVGGTLATYSDLAAALGTNSANVPEEARKGGMSIKFVQSSDNKYVQFRYMLEYANTTAGNAAFVNEANWQGVDDVPTAGSQNLVKSGGVYDFARDKIVKTINGILDLASDDFAISLGWINTDGVFIVNKGRNGLVNIGVNEFSKILIKANSTGNTYLAFLTSNILVANENAPLVPGSSLITITAESTSTYEIPQGTEYIYIYCSSTNTGSLNRFPEKIALTSIFRTSVDEAVYQKFNKLDNDIYRTFNNQPLDLTGYPKDSGFIAANGKFIGKFISDENSKHILVPINFFGVKFLANSTGAFYYAFLKNDELIGGQTAPFAEGCSLVTVSENEQTDEIPVPSDATYLYVFVQSGTSDRTPQATISYTEVAWQEPISEFSEEVTQISDEVTQIQANVKTNPYVFSFDFTKTFDASIIEGTYTSDSNGLTLTNGFSNKIKFKCYLSAVDCYFKSKIKLTGNKNAVVTISSVDENRGSNHASIVAFDFSSGKIIVYPKNSGATIPQTSYREVSFSSTSDMFYIEVGRENRNLYACVIDYYTLSKTSVLIDEDVVSDYKYPCGWLHDCPCLSQISGDTCYFQSFVGDVKRSDIVFLGNSITEGYGITYDNSWVAKVCESLGYCANYGRSNERIEMLQLIVDTVLSIIRPKYVVVTIGTNGGNTLENLTKLHNSIINIGAVPIFNHIYKCDSQAQIVTETNTYIEQIGCLSARFDIATSIDNNLNLGEDTSLYQSDGIHLNQAGNAIVAERFLSDMEFLKYLEN